VLEEAAAVKHTEIVSRASNIAKAVLLFKSHQANRFINQLFITFCKQLY
jgi:hypothetical protein